MVWYVFVLGACVVAMVIVVRRKPLAIIWATLCVVGPLGTGIVFLMPPGPGIHVTQVSLIGIGIVVFGVGCFGLLPRRVKIGRCSGCGYRLMSLDEGASTQCPECGVPHPEMAGRCLACKEDIRSAIAGGSMKCPHCGEPVPDRNRA